MEHKKTSKKSSKTAEISVTPLAATESPLADSKPVKRTPAKRSSSTVAKAKPVVEPSAPKTSTHRHSKLSSPTASPVSAMNYEEVARLAYHYWEERSYAHGFADEDWHRAMKTVSARA